MAGALLRAALVASCFRGAFPPVDLRAVCFVRAMSVTTLSRSKKSGMKALEGYTNLYLPRCLLIGQNLKLVIGCLPERKLF